MNRNGRSIAVIAAFSLLASCAGSQKPAGQMENVTELQATVTAVDLPQRLITLKGEGLEEVVVEATDAVKNLDQVNVGDVVTVSYTEALAWQVRAAGQGGPGVGTGEDVTTAAPGAKPSVAAKQTFKITASITAIDMEKGTVTLMGPQGNSRTFKARDPGNLKKVKVGDLVDLTYTQALAIAVQPENK